MLVLGEVHTGLLQHSATIASQAATGVLGLRLGEVVRTFERPISYAVSPEVFTGVDCRLATRSNTRLRAVGTVGVRAALTGGRLLQTSAVARVVGGGGDHRRPWSYYLATPGQLETLGGAFPDGRSSPADVADGHLAAPQPGGAAGAPNAPGASGSPTGLDLGAITGRLMDTVQRSPRLDRRPPFKAARTRLRWVLRTADGDGPDRLAFTVEPARLRTVALTATDLSVTQAVEFCEDLARHDWLLSTLLTLVERVRLDLGAGPDAVTRMRPVVDHLLHLWMPGARLDDRQLAFWAGAERASGFSRQWRAQVNRVRDQLSVHTITVLRAAAEGTREGV